MTTTVTRVCAVVPGAGFSRRMGEPKLLLPFGGETVVGSTIQALVGGGAGRICLVARPEDVELIRWAGGRGLELALNPRPELGMLSSILSGLAALGGPEGLATTGEALLVTPADLPALRAETVRAVVEAVEAGAALAVPRHRGRRGHPLAIGPALVAELARLDTADEAGGLRQLLDRPGLDLVEVEVDDAGAVRDVDTPEDYRRLAAQE